MTPEKKQEELVDQWKLHLQVTRALNNLTPSRAKKIDLDDIYLKEIMTAMSAFLKKELREALKCYSSSLWTATALMCFRIIEREIKRYLKIFHNVTETMSSLGSSINQFKQYSTNESFLQNLERINELRNRGMHGEDRFAPRMVKDLLRTTLIIVSWTNNIKRKLQET